MSTERIEGAALLSSARLLNGQFFLHVSERKRVLVEQLMEEIEEMRARKALAKAGEPGL